MPRPNDSVETIVKPFDQAAIADAAERIVAGECIAIPTETVYGLAADATNGEAVAGIYAAKGRPSFNPLIVHVRSAETAAQIAQFDQLAQTLAERFWPGPLTIVLPLRDGHSISSLVCAGLSTIALRVPEHPAMRALLKASGKPLAAPSANASGTISPTRADHVVASLGGRIGLVIDTGPTGHGLESTIVRPTASAVHILRPGPISSDEIEATTGVAATYEVPETINAPGQLASHYAPTKPLRLNARDAAPGEWLIGFGAVTGHATLSASGDLVEAAASLFGLLHDADAAALPRIAVAPVPAEGLGVAINDRLKRAAVRD